jgi:hypothetical protein
MPTDPKTGERLPYPGEPGYEEGAENPAPAEGGEAAPDINQLIDQLDQMAGEDQAAEGEPTEGAAEEASPSQDLSALTETLGVTPERAEILYQAAQQLASTQGKSPEELAEIIANDFDILMQLEVIAARSLENQPEPMPQEGAPMPPEAGGTPPEMMPPEGM